MICPKCGRDYNDPGPGKDNGRFYAGDDHFYKKHRRYGKICNHCGFIAEIIAKPTGRPYQKSDQENPDKSLDLEINVKEKNNVSR